MKVPPNARYLHATQDAFTAPDARRQVRFRDVLRHVKWAGGSAGAASWCLFFLTRLGRIEAVPHEPPPGEDPDPRAYVLHDTTPASWEDVRQLGARARAHAELKRKPK